MDLIELMDKNKRLRRAFYLYAVFTLINFGIHVANYYHGFLPDFGDHALYLIKAAVCFYVLITFKNNRMARYQGIVPIMRLMICLDITELVLSMLTTGVSRNETVIYIVFSLIILKFVLDFCFYLEFIYEKKDRLSFSLINILLIVVSCLCIRYPFWAIALFLFVLRTIYSLLFIKLGSSCTSENADISGTSIFSGVMNINGYRRVVTGIYGAVALILIIFSFVCLYKPDGKYELKAEAGSASVSSSTDSLYSIYHIEERHKGENEEYKQYVVYNLIRQKVPVLFRTGFERIWTGLINVKTGEKTNAEFNHFLSFDDSGIAYDYDGHFIDVNGNTVITLPYIVKAKRSVRTSIFNAIYGAVRNTPYEYMSFPKRFKLLDLADMADKTFVSWNCRYTTGSNFKQFDRHIRDDAVTDFTYFYENSTVFYSEVKGAYGIMNDKGEVILDPCIYDYHYISSGIMEVTMKNTGLPYVINLKGEIVSDVDQ